MQDISTSFKRDFTALIYLCMGLRVPFTLRVVTVQMAFSAIAAAATAAVAMSCSVFLTVYLFNASNDSFCEY